MNSRGSLPPAAWAVVLLLASLRPAGLDAAAGERGKIWLELSGGCQALAPADLNLAVDADERSQYLRYDRYLQYLQDGGQIRSWSATAGGGRSRIEAGWLLEPRLRCQLSGWLSLSAGLRLMRAGRSRDLLYEFTRVRLDGDLYVETLAISPYRLSVQSYWPSVGIHFRRPIGRRFSAEAQAAAGPLFASASYRSAWTYAWDMRGADYSWPVFRDAGERSEKGSGTGIGLELVARVACALGNRLEVFLAGGYSWQRVNSLSGPGLESRAGRVETWSGQWLTRNETLVTPWQTLAVQFPTSRPQAGADDGPFRLDLSGWQLRAGVSWKL